MARTAGSISLVSVNFRELVKQIAGDEIASQIQYTGFIDVSKKWIENYLNPTCDIVMIPATDLQNPLIVRPNLNGEPVRPLEMTRACNAPVPQPSKSSEFSFDPNED
jgi:hypothetical protein